MVEEKRKKKLAIFDVDKTLFEFDTGKKFLLFLLKKGELKFNPINIIKLNLAYFLYKINKLNYKSIRSMKFDFIENQRVKKVNRLIEEYYTTILKDNVQKAMKKIVLKHKKKGYKIVLLSASPKIILKHISDEIGADYLICSKFKTNNGIFTGTIEWYNFGPWKLEKFREFIGNRKYSLKDSYFYSDSFYDMPVFKIVDNPVAVNPDRKLRKHAEKNKWKIIEFR